MNATASYRYPGSRPFLDTDYDRRLFFGRAQEQAAFLHLVLAEKLVVLFAQSGMGKTSLLNAGILNPLRERNFLPLSIRFTPNRSSKNPLDMLYQGIHDAAVQARIEGAFPEKNTLWEYFKTAEFWSARDVLLTPVLILDQFEEFFEFYSVESRAEFIRQFADLIRGSIPQQLRATIEPDHPLPYTEDPPAVKVVIALREETFGKLDELASEIPDILRHCFRLTALTREQAHEAIIHPAQIDDQQIGRHPFRYTENAVTAMLDFLCRPAEKSQPARRNDVDPFQLQLLCQHVETLIQTRIDQGQTDLTVNKEDLAGENGMQHVVDTFYEQQLQQIPSATERRHVYDLCERGLLSATHKRQSLPEEQIIQDYKVSAQRLQQLVNTRLLRAESRLESVYYELSHDNFIKPVQKTREHRLAQQKKLSRRLIALALITIVFLGFANAKFYYYVLGQIASARQEYEVACTHFQRALDLDPKFAKAYIGLADTYLAQEKYPEAIQSYQQASKLLKTPSPELSRKLGKALTKATVTDQDITSQLIAQNLIAVAQAPENVQSHLSLGELYLKQKDYASAIAHYRNAVQLAPTNVEGYIKLGAAFLAQGDFSEAIRTYQQAIQANPHDARIYSGLGDVQFIAHQYDQTYDVAYNETRAAYQQALEYAPDDPAALKGIGNIFFVQRNYPTAIEQYQKVLDRHPEDGDTSRRLGDALRHQGRYAEAFGHYERALQTRPTDSAVYSGLGHVFLAQGNYLEAENNYTLAWELDPQNPNLKLNLARVHLVSEHFYQTLGLTEGLLAEENRFTPPENRLSLRVLAASGLFLIEKPQEAYLQVKGFTTLYASLAQDFERTLTWNEIKVFIENTAKLPEPEKQILLKMLTCLELPLSETSATLKELAASFPE